MVHWKLETIEYFTEKNKPGCEGQYIRELSDFVYQNCIPRYGETYQNLIEDLIAKTKR